MLPVHDTSTITSALAASTYADLSSITSMESSDGTVSYTYDPTGQLLSATYTGVQSDEMYTYDANGNRTTDGYVTGADNRLLSDGTYCYAYDAEGNRTTRFIDVNQNTLLDAGDTDVTEYSWDNRSRLIKVIDRAVANGPITQAVDYLYDTEDRWIGRDIDLDADGIIDQMTRFAYNGPQIILQFDKTGSESLDASDLSHRYLWNPTAVDHLMADEQVETLSQNTPGDVILPLTDHLGTIRDLATYDPATYTTTITTHRVYDAYGTLLTATGSIDCLFAFTGRPFDESTDLQNNYHRWYDAITDRWMSQDPIGFNGEDTNTYRYVANSPVDRVDPSGLVDITGIGYNERIVEDNFARAERERVAREDGLRSNSSSPTFHVSGNAVNPYIDLKIGQWWTKFPIISSLNNQNALTQIKNSWNGVPLRSYVTIGRRSVTSHLHSSGNFCCNAPVCGDLAGGAVVGYVKCLAEGTYEVSYYYKVTLEQNGNALVGATITEPGSYLEVFKKSLCSEDTNHTFDSGWCKRTAKITVGSNDKTPVFRYEPGATTPRGATASDNATVHGEFIIYDIRRISQ